tara:strand:+ start:105 stop:467 length:363 start_codon:yes stop_codon:yes gene_type:complete
MPLHHREYKRNYWEYILGTIHEDTEGNELWKPEDKKKYLFDRFYSEYGWEVERVGKRQAMINWLQGLALNIEYTYGSIIQLAQEMGSLDFYREPNEKLEDKICNNYWNFMANIILENENK